MHSRMLKFHQGHVIANNHILISHNLLKTFPSQISIFNKVHRNPLRRLRWGRHSGLEQSDFNGNRRIYIKNLDGQLRHRKARLDNPKFRRPMFRLLSWWLGRFPKSSVLDKVFLLSLIEGWNWNWASGLTASSTTSFLLFSFMVAKEYNSNNKV